MGKRDGGNLDAGASMVVEQGSIESLPPVDESGAEVYVPARANIYVDPKRRRLLIRRQRARDAARAAAKAAAESDDVYRPRVRPSNLHTGFGSSLSHSPLFLPISPPLLFVFPSVPLFCQCHGLRLLKLCGVVAGGSCHCRHCGSLSIVGKPALFKPGPCCPQLARNDQGCGAPEKRGNSTTALVRDFHERRRGLRRRL